MRTIEQERETKRSKVGVVMSTELDVRDSVSSQLSLLDGGWDHIRSCTRWSETVH